MEENTKSTDPVSLDKNMDAGNAQNTHAQALSDLSKIGSADSEQAQTLSRIEELLKQQLLQTVKMRRADCVRTIVTVILAVVLITVSVMGYILIKDLSRELPVLIQNANTLLENANALIIKAAEQMTAILEQIDKIDFEGINTIIKGAAEVNFQALNDSIEALDKGVKGFQEFVDKLKNPFGL